MLLRIEPGVGYRVLREARARTQLGAGPDGALPGAAIAHTIDAVERFLRDVARTACRVLAVATAAVRDAPNAGELLGHLSRELGLDVEVLAPDEEGRLGALAARASLQLRDATVVDLGGCSLQISALRDREPVSIASAPLGMWRAFHGFLAHDPPTSMELTALRRAVREAVGGRLPRAAGAEALVGIGGTARTLARLRVGQRARAVAQRRRLGREELAVMCGHLAVVRRAERRQLAGLKAGRADAIVAGAVVLDELVRLGGYAGLVVAEHGVRHGVLLRETFERVRA
jgi:exopolyphosphatase/guanosine-5'-triphosphate,3'-diphosphate pyrophosphatase